jgi:phosphorylcholine metabolism protein LicD
VRRREWPWRFLWIRSFLLAFLSRPIQACKLLKPLYKGSLTPQGYDLKLQGPGLLRTVLEESHRAGIQPFLVWGTLLGCVREAAFIWNDNDIDLATLPEDFAKLPTLIDAMMKRGFRVRINDRYKVSLVNPRYKMLCIDIDLVYQKNGRAVITNSADDEKNDFSYVFPPEAFSRFKVIRFVEGIEVLIPLAPEIFLEAAYGDWKTPQKKADHLHGVLNLVIEPKTLA